MVDSASFGLYLTVSVGELFIALFEVVDAGVAGFLKGVEAEFLEFFED